MGEAVSISTLQDAIRRWARLKVDVPACVVIQKENRTLFITARLKDISQEGAAVQAGIELKVDTEIHIEFTPAFDGTPLRVRAVVRHRRGYTYGCEFVSQSEAEEASLKMLKAVLMPTGVPAEGSVHDRKR